MRRETHLDEDQLLEDAHPAVREVVLELAERAVAAGADPSRLEYVGAGMESVTFRDGKAAFKVARGRRSLRDEADALSALNAMGHQNVPAFYAYDPDLEVIVRQYIDGRVGGWNRQRQLYTVYMSIVEALATAEFSNPEWKEDSFVIGPDDHVYMVDLGFTYPIGARGVVRLNERLDDPTDDDIFMFQLEIAVLTREGTLTYDQGLRLYHRMAERFGSEKVATYLREYALNYAPVAPNTGRTLAEQSAHATAFAIKANIGRFVGTCDRVRRRGDEQEQLWHEMVRHARKITPQQFLAKVDMSKVLDEDESPEGWLGDIMRSDPSATAYESVWGDRLCWFIESDGFEFIFIDADS